MGQSQLIHLFPTSIYVNVLDSALIINDYFEGKLDPYDFTSSDDVLTGEYIGKSDMHHNPDFTQFYVEITRASIDYLDKLGVKSELFDPYITKSWLSIIDKPDYHMKFHSHTVADISFVYYLQVPENADCICFKNTHTPNDLFPSMSDLQRQDRNFIREESYPNFTSYFVKPEIGMLVLFPGKLSHGTIPYPMATGPQIGKRIAVVGDINLYLKSGLNNYESGRISPDFMRKFRT